MLKIPGLTLAVHGLFFINEFEDSAQQRRDEHLLYERYLFHLLLFSFLGCLFGQLLWVVLNERLIYNCFFVSCKI